ncbi:MAG TPA: hypothetical protein V6D19_22875 [Stenomitos sp.]
MSVQENAARLFKQVHAEQDRQLRLQAIENPSVFTQLAEQQGYRLDRTNLASAIESLSDEAIAAIWNPGIGPRRHLVRR